MERSSRHEQRHPGRHRSERPADFNRNGWPTSGRNYRPTSSECALCLCRRGFAAGSWRGRPHCIRRRCVSRSVRMRPGKPGRQTGCGCGGFRGHGCLHDMPCAADGAGTGSADGVASRRCGADALRHVGHDPIRAGRRDETVPEFRHPGRTFAQARSGALFRRGLPPRGGRVSSRRRGCLGCVRADTGSAGNREFRRGSAAIRLGCSDLGSSGCRERGRRARSGPLWVIARSGRRRRTRPGGNRRAIAAGAQRAGIRRACRLGARGWPSREIRWSSPLCRRFVRSATRFPLFLVAARRQWRASKTG